MTELNASGSALIYSTYLGGNGDDEGSGIALDGSGNAYVVGETSSTNFPTTPGAVQTSYGGGAYNGFVTKLITYEISPTVNVSATSVADSSSIITITGAGFSPAASSNSVVFNLGVMGTVTSASSTQLTVTITTPPTALGNLTAVVSTDGVSGPAEQVGTEVSGDWVVTDAGGGEGSLSDVTLPYAVDNALNGDQITFAVSLSGSTIALTNILTVDTNVSIIGLGAANLTISGSNVVQVFYILGNTTVSISNLTVVDGNSRYNSGGGIVSSGTLTLDNSIITDNSARASAMTAC